MVRGRLYGIFADARHYFVLKRKEALEARGNSPALRRLEKALREHYSNLPGKYDSSKNLDSELAAVSKSFK